MTRMSHRQSRSAKSSLGVIGSTVADAEATEATGAPSTPIEAVDAATEGGMEMPLEILRDTSVVALLENVLEEVVDLVSGRVLATHDERERASLPSVVYKGVDANSKDADGAFESDCCDLSLEDLVGYDEFEDNAAKVNLTTMAPATSPKTTAALRRWNAVIRLPRDETAPAEDADGNNSNNSNKIDDNESLLRDGAAVEAASKQTLLNQIWELTQAAKQKDAKLARLEDKVARLEEEKATLQRKKGKRGIRKRLELAALVRSAMAANIADLRDAYARYVEDFLEVLGDIEEI